MLIVRFVTNQLDTRIQMLRLFHDYADMMYLSLPLVSLTAAHYISQDALVTKLVETVYVFTTI